MALGFSSEIMLCYTYFFHSVYATYMFMVWARKKSPLSCGVFIFLFEGGEENKNPCKEMRSFSVLKFVGLWRRGSLSGFFKKMNELFRSWRDDLILQFCLRFESCKQVTSLLLGKNICIYIYQMMVQLENTGNRGDVASRGLCSNIII